MSTTQLIYWNQLAASASLACLGVGRALTLTQRRVRVIPLDRKWWPIQVLFYLVLFGVLFLYAFEMVAHGWPLQGHLIPEWLRKELMDLLLLKWVGALAVWAGALTYGLAVWALGSSWRMGVDLDTPGPLVTTGVFSWSRNPIYLAFDLYTIGTFLVYGGLFFFIFALLSAAALHGVIRIEEHYLVKIYGDPYREYCARVGRYIGVRTASGK